MSCRHRRLAPRRAFTLGCAPFLLFLLVHSARLRAQAPAAAPPPEPEPAPRVWAGSVGTGIALTGGNTNTTSVNVTLTGTYNPESPHLMTADALYLRSTSQGDVVLNRLSFDLRDEYSLGNRALVFGQLRYLRDTFKSLDSLVAPAFGFGYRIIQNGRTTLKMDAGAGAVWEKDAGFVATRDGSFNFGQTLSHRLSTVATLNEALTALWKTSDVSNALYTFGVGVTASITPRSQLKVDLLETYKTLPPAPGIKKQDVSLVTSLVYAFK